MTNRPSLTIEGKVNRERSFNAEQLAALPGQVPDVSKLAPDREGAAVKLTSVLDLAGIATDARFITIHAEGNYSASVPLDAVKDHAILIYKLGDAPLPHDKGGPVRFFIPDVAACQTDEVDKCANVKYVQRIVLSSEPGADTRPRTLRQHVDLHRGETR
jgi:DMSO/TMAO reductase YedYZ molybdopterin-dependent catalytic subunit